MRCRLGGLLHDIGTAAVGDRVLGLIGPPTARDRLAYEAHPAAGARLVRSVAGVSGIAAIVETHEEWFDGTGHAAGLCEGEIPLESRIVACAVAYVGLARLAGGSEAVGGLQRQAGSALDPEVVIAALALLARDAGHPARRMGDVRTT